MLKTQGRMPKTVQEIQDYLDLIDHSNKYAEAFKMEQLIGKSMMKRLGYETPEEIKKQGKNRFRYLTHQ